MLAVLDPHKRVKTFVLQSSTSRGQCLNKSRLSALCRRSEVSGATNSDHVVLSKPDTEDKEPSFLKKRYLLSSNREHSENLCRNRGKLRKVRLSCTPDSFDHRDLSRWRL